MMRKRARPDKKTGRDRTMVYADEKRAVPNNSFYRRAILRGDLKEVTGVPTPAPTPKPAKGETAKGSKAEG
jgi:hypothetical protein